MTGWGYREVWGMPSDILLKVVVPIVTDEECQKMFDVLPELIVDSMICAGYSSGGKGACRVGYTAPRPAYFTGGN